MNKLMGSLLLVAACGKVPPPGGTAGTFSLALETDTAFVRENQSIEIAVTVTREMMVEPIAITVAGLPDGVSAEPLEIAGDSTTGMLVINTAAMSRHGHATLQVTGSADVDDEPIMADAPPLQLLVGGASGSLDRSFASDGTFTPSLGGLAIAARDLEVTSQGIFVTGFVVSNPVQAITARVREDGTLDPTYGSGGFVSTGLGGVANAIALTVFPDGSVITAGTAGGAGAECEFGLFKYTPSGALDSSFGLAGVASFDPGTGCAQWRNISIATDGSIIVSGTLSGSTTRTLAAKFSSTGERLTDFNVFLNDVAVQGAALQPDGKLVIVGQQAGNFFVSRFRDDSIEDGGFSNVSPDFSNQNDTAHGLVVLPDGKLLVVGISAVVGAAISQLAIARLNSNGSLDLTFGTGGKLVGPSFDSQSSTAIAVRGPHLYFVGRRVADRRPAVARILLADGAMDTTFGQGGIATVDFGIAGTTATTGGFGVALDSEGRVVISGDVGASGGQSMAIARLWF